MRASEAATEVVYQVALEQSKYWKCIDVKACEPPEGMSSFPILPPSSFLLPPSSFASSFLSTRFKEKKKGEIDYEAM